MRDLDPWRATADEAARRDQQLRRAMEIARIGTWEWVVATNQVYWSQELYTIYGLPLDGFAGTVEAFLERVHPEDRQASLATVRRAMESGEPFDFHERIVRPDGEIRFLHSQGEVVRDAEGRTLRLFGVCQDVTTQREAEAQVRRGEQAAATRRVLHGLAELLPAVAGALDLARELVVITPAAPESAQEAGRQHELIGRLEDAHATLAELTGGPGDLLPRAR